MSILLIVAGLLVAGLVIGFFATATAPVGYEDEKGFHFGSETSQGVTTRALPAFSEVAEAAQLTPKHA